MRLKRLSVGYPGFLLDLASSMFLIGGVGNITRAVISGFDAGVCFRLAATTRFGKSMTVASDSGQYNHTL